MMIVGTLRKGWGVRNRNRPRTRRVVLVVVFVGAAIYPLVANNGFVFDIATDMALWAVLAIGLNAVLGWAGLLDLGYIAFFALGGYSFAILDSMHIMSFWPSLGVGVGISAVAALIIGIPTLRLHSDYLAIMTLGFGLIVYIAAQNLTVTGGDNGLFGYAPPQIGSLVIDTPFSYYVLALVLTVVAAGVASWVRSSRLGRAWLLLRDDETAATSVGVAVWRYKLYAYLFGSVWGTLSGAAYAVKETIVSPVSFSFTESFFVVAAVVIGGTGSIAGCVIGGGVYVLISEAMGGVSATLSGVLFAAAMLGFILLRPRGLVPAHSGVARKRKERRPSRVGAYVDVVMKTGRGFSVRKEASSSSGLAGLGASLEAQGIEVEFGGVQAVAGASFVCAAGTVLALIGPNGAGKTTLLNAVSGLAQMKRGQVALRLPDRTVDLTHKGARVRALWQIGRTFQTPRLSRGLTVWENVLQGTFAAGREGRSDWRPAGTVTTHAGSFSSSLATDSLAMVGLLDKAEAIAGDLAYGDQRRCEIARALASSPIFVLMDEPSSGMNDVETEQISGLVRRLAGLGLGIVIVEHDMSLVRAAADEVVALDLGRVICRGSAATVLTDPVVRGRYLGE